MTYLKAFDEIRKTFAATHEARLRNFGPGRFSFNVEGGRCNACEGNGFLTIDMQFLADVMIRCPECRGTRYRPETLEVTYRGRNIAEVLELTAREAFAFFRHRPKVQAKLRPMLDVGLDYLRLGQPASTLSGGEAQRLKLASHLATSPTAMTRMSGRSRTLFLLDEPTTGLHPADTLKLLDALNSLLDLGHSLILDRAQPRDHGLRRLDHRPRPRRGRRRRADRRPGDPRDDRRPRHPHRSIPEVDPGGGPLRGGMSRIGSRWLVPDSVDPNRHDRLAGGAYYGVQRDNLKCAPGIGPTAGSRYRMFARAAERDPR